MPNSNWQLSDANREYKVPSQPSGESGKMWVPASQGLPEQQAVSVLLYTLLAFTKF